MDAHAQSEIGGDQPVSRSVRHLMSLMSRFRRAFEAFESPTRCDAPHEPTRQLVISLERDRLDGGWVAECLDLPGCVGQGETRHEALEDVVEAIAAVLSVRMEQQLPPENDNAGDVDRIALTV